MIVLRSWYQRFGVIWCVCLQGRVWRRQVPPKRLPVSQTALDCTCFPRHLDTSCVPPWDLTSHSFCTWWMSSRSIMPSLMTVITIYTCGSKIRCKEIRHATCARQLHHSVHNCKSLGTGWIAEIYSGGSIWIRICWTQLSPYTRSGSRITT